ncbi:MAG TPA: hypothetical protein VFU60_03400 [Ktedonobacterales bacterium]|nr:hypothetical protein [Ktedonobacterales bacterium]
MQKRVRAGWFGLFQRAEPMERRERATHGAHPITTGALERYPTHSCVVLPDGQLMYVRHADLAAAKDLLAAQRAAERRMRAEPHADLVELADLAELAAESAR